MREQHFQGVPKVLAPNLKAFIPLNLARCDFSFFQNILMLSKFISFLNFRLVQTGSSLEIRR